MNQEQIEAKMEDIGFLSAKHELVHDAAVDMCAAICTAAADAHRVAEGTTAAFYMASNMLHLESEASVRRMDTTWDPRGHDELAEKFLKHAGEPLDFTPTGKLTVPAMEAHELIDGLQRFTQALSWQLRRIERAAMLPQILEGKLRRINENRPPEPDPRDLLREEEEGGER